MMENKPELLCRVCGDKASGKHYGVTSCDGCRGFFKRSIRRNLDYVCKENSNCIVDVTRRNQCQACRFLKCLQVNMKRDAVQHERAPRSSAGKPQRILAGHAHFLQHPPHPFFLFPPNANHIHQQSITHHRQFTPFERPIPQQQQQQQQQHQQTTSSAEEEVSSTGGVGEVSGGRNGSGGGLIFGPVCPVGESVYEAAARLLFISIKWTRSVPSFAQLSVRDQAILLEECWPEIFVLSAAQWGLAFDPVLLAGSGVLNRCREEMLLRKARLLQGTIQMVQTLRPDHTELACLKALSLFRPAPSLGDLVQVEVLQEQTQLMLLEYSAPAGKNRFGKLLLLLPTLRRVDGCALEELFFRQTIGDVSIERLLEDLVKGGRLL